MKSLIGIDECVIGDATLVAYLFETLRKRCGVGLSDVSLSPSDGKYAEFRISCRDLHLTPKQCNVLFTEPSVENIPFFVCRQIVRECAAQTNLHGCGIVVTADGENGVTVSVVLPRYNFSRQATSCLLTSREWQANKGSADK